MLNKLQMPNIVRNMDGDSNLDSVVTIENHREVQIRH